ncbi:carbohydrate ABC transporter permease [Paenibacillus sp. JCM 10914]|uniref:carbohydrate ABC transporter permease n=1 Tax=Paenibacillus sp. JCM 10914 TaxID=1236974 RepID=UPI0003CCBAB1|nr:carbohydrate ABC transporter permease [Paenibacillus sp. JCM 10914]GAE06546.1 xylose ABC transporter, ATP-binding component [Paenibacillus sp. JCM 10914]
MLLKKLKLSHSMVYVLLCLLLVTQLYPLIWLLLYSFKTNEEILSGHFFSIPSEWKWENYTSAIESGNYFQYLFNSVTVTFSTLIVVIVLSSLAAFAIARFQWKYNKAFLLLFLIGMMIPLQATLLPLMVIFKNLGLLNTRFSMILPYIAFQIPISMFILSAFMKTIPQEIDESAIIDGASVYQIYWNIIIPISIPPVVTVCILSFINVWNEYILASTFVSSEHLKTLPFGVYSFVSQYSANYGSIGAYLVLGALPVILIYFMMAEKITKGMVAGAVKG